VHLLPLPYHTWSFVVSRGIVALRNIDCSKAQILLDQLYNGDQSLFGNQVLAKTGEDDVLQKLVQYVSDTLKVDVNTFISKYQDSDISNDARIEFKNSASHAVAATPTFFVNGTPTDIDGYSFAQWKQLIDSLL
jgi:hypothetical protein